MATVPETAAELPEEGHAKPPFLRRVKIRNYKSIAYCDVPLGPLTVIVGRNGSGKSNFLDALGFLRDAMATNLNEAVKRHGGPAAVRHQPVAPGAALGFECDFHLGEGAAYPVVEYHLTLPAGVPGSGGQPDETFVGRTAAGEPKRATRGAYFRSLTRQADAGADADLFDALRAGEKLFPGVYSADPGVIGTLGRMVSAVEIQNVHPNAIRQLQKTNPGGLLDRDGGNLADVFRQLRTRDPDLADRVRDYLAAITEQVLDVWPVQYGEYETLRFKLDAGRGNPPLEFDAASMSDGTLRVLAALVAVFQVLPGGGHPSLVGIEEPETALHPAASRALVDALDEATMHTQVVITTHSADILDDPDLEHATILVARYKNGRTEIAPVDAASREIVKEELNTYGGMLRTDQLEPDHDDLARQDRDAKKEG